MTAPRASLAAVLAVVVAGVATGAAGLGTLGPRPEAAWHEATSLVVPRTYAQATKLVTGEVLITGGLDRDSSEVVRDRAEVFDPRSGRAVVATNGTGLLWNSLTTLPNDLVLSVGGVERDPVEGWGPVRVASAFDPWTRTWHDVAQPEHARSDHGATLLADGRVIVVGGHRGPAFERSVEIYDSLRDRWTAAAPLPRGRSQFSIARLPDGRVLVAGGFLEPGLATDTSAIYDPRSDSWRDGPALSVARALHTTVSLPNGDLLLVGGQRGAAGTADRYNARLGAFVFAGTLVLPRMYAQGAAETDGSVVVVGGFLRPDSGDGFIPTATSERWDPASNTWTAGPPSRVARAAAATVAVAGSVYLFGGSAEGDHALASVEELR